MNTFKAIDRCRICGNPDLKSVMNLGLQELTGVFPHSKEEPVASGPLEVLRCSGEDNCGLVQLAHSFDLSQMYGQNYGYRSGLNPSMVTHLKTISEQAASLVDLRESDCILDIGSNDGTLLGSYPQGKYKLIGVDPTGVKFREFYAPEVTLVPDFFPSSELEKFCGNGEARIITSISMFYDLEDPLSFCRSIKDTLANDGVWIFEQSYVKLMVENLSFDTICHEHLEFYALKQIDWLLRKSGLRAIDVQFNPVNGGSMRIAACHSEAPLISNGSFEKALADELASGLNSNETWKKFSQAVESLRNDVMAFLKKNKAEKKIVIGLGASTKGNVLLQYFGIGPDLLPFIADVNPDKYLKFTPGTRIPIISEEEAGRLKPDYKFVLPWHFRDFFLKKESAFLESGGGIVFPLPSMEVCKKDQGQ